MKFSLEHFVSNMPPFYCKCQIRHFNVDKKHIYTVNKHVKFIDKSIGTIFASLLQLKKNIYNL